MLDYQDPVTSEEPDATQEPLDAQLQQARQRKRFHFKLGDSSKDDFTKLEPAATPLGCYQKVVRNAGRSDTEFQTYGIARKSLREKHNLIKRIQATIVKNKTRMTDVTVRGRAAGSKNYSAENINVLLNQIQLQRMG